MTIGGGLPGTTCIGDMTGELAGCAGGAIGLTGGMISIGGTNVTGGMTTSSSGGTNDTGGTLQALTINLPLVVDGKCPEPKSS